MKRVLTITAMVLALAFAVGIHNGAMAASYFGPDGIGVDTHTGSAVMDHTNQFGGDKARNSLSGADRDAGWGGPQFESYGLQGDYSRSSR